MKDEAIPSPCIRACTLDEQDICLGCHRSLEEIIEWSQANAPRKQAILRAAAVRREQQQYRKKQ